MLLPEIVDLVDRFQTNSDNLLHKHSYFREVCKYLLECNRFLEIGYRKGIFVEVCKLLGTPSVHIDISDDLLRAKPTFENRCFTMDSLSYLRNCSNEFDLIFQDGSKKFSVRKKEYDYILSSNIISKNGTIIVDDLHYPDCRKAMEYAKGKFKIHVTTKKVRDKSEYVMGFIRVGK